eukprot:1746901-Prymnesium_polylepis.1
MTPPPRSPFGQVGLFIVESKPIENTTPFFVWRSVFERLFTYDGLRRLVARTREAKPTVRLTAKLRARTLDSHCVHVASRAVSTWHLALCPRGISHCVHVASRAVSTRHLALCPRGISHCIHVAGARFDHRDGRRRLAPAQPSVARLARGLA